MEEGSANLFCGGKFCEPGSLTYFLCAGPLYGPGPGLWPQHHRKLNNVHHSASPHHHHHSLACCEQQRQQPQPHVGLVV
jgi:hypothetical protein